MVIALATIPVMVLLVKSQYKQVLDGTFADEGYSWDRGQPKYKATLIWDKKGDINFLIIPFLGVIFLWACWALITISDLTWLEIWLAPKLYLLEYAAHLVK